MRFMMMVIPEGYESAAPDAVPSAEAVAKMMEYNKAAAKSRSPARAGWPVSSFHRSTHLLHGRQADGDRRADLRRSKEVIGGYWIIQVRSREEAIEWAKRAPMSNNEVIEVRQIHEMPDFPEDVQKAAEGFEHRNVVA